MNETVDLDAVLRKHGHRVTEPRRVVWDVLGSAVSHLTAEQITDQAQSREPGVNRASIYRSLTLFADLGLARESNLGSDDAARWELAHPDDQFHLICESCGIVQHHAGDLVHQVRSHLFGDHGFVVNHIELSVTGTCSACAQPLWS